jgi:hypothetical protein
MALWLYGLARTALCYRHACSFPVFGLLAVLAGAAFAHADRLRRPQLDTGWLLRVIVVLTLALLLVTQVVGFLATQSAARALRRGERDAYERRQLGVYPEVMAAMNALPAGSRVIFLWEPRSYACREVECWPDALLDRLPLTHAALAGRAGDCRRLAGAQGFTHVLWYEHGMRFIDEAEFDPLGPADLQVAAELQAEFLQPVETWEDAYTLYAWRR